MSCFIVETMVINPYLDDIYIDKQLHYDLELRVQRLRNISTPLNMKLHRCLKEEADLPGNVSGKILPEVI